MWQELCLDKMSLVLYSDDTPSVLMGIEMFVYQPDIMAFGVIQFLPNQTHLLLVED